MAKVITMHVSGVYKVVAETEDTEEAKKMAVEAWENEDFGALENIDAEIISVE